MIWNTYETVCITPQPCHSHFVVDCCQFGHSWIFGPKWSLWPVSTWLEVQRSKAVFFLSLYDSINDMKYFRNCLNYTSAVPKPFLLLIATNLALAGFLGWKWSLWPVPDWLEVQRSKYVFLLDLYDSINDMKHFRTFCIRPNQCHSHFCSWLLSIWFKLDFWAENWAYGLCWLGWRYNVAKLSFSWPYMIVSII